MFCFFLLSICLFVLLFAGQRQQGTEPAFMFCAGSRDDSDVKIAGDRPAADLSIREDPGANDDYLIEKENGNIERAKLLGQNLAKILSKDFADECMLHLEPDSEDARTKTQVLLLFAFAIDRGLNTHVPNSTLINTAHTSFFNTLQEISPDVYDQISDTGAYSLYMLCARREGAGVCRSIGESFAKLCGKEDDVALSSTGEMIFSIFLNMVKVEVVKMEFVDSSAA